MASLGVTVLTGCGAKKADAKDNQAYRTLDEIKKSGKIVEEGKLESFFEEPKTDRLRRFLQTFTYE